MAGSVRAASGTSCAASRRREGALATIGWADGPEAGGEAGGITSVAVGAGPMDVGTDVCFAAGPLAQAESNSSVQAAAR
ncbi:hypothetical protein [Xanthomonas sp. 10-10]|uniref:Uncharacterized protein n=1 Tax=Xanthomonas sp. 10-10 TaxID=3115848 RepID=A0AAU7P8K0_9XANT